MPFTNFCATIDRLGQSRHLMLDFTTYPAFYHIITIMVSNKTIVHKILFKRIHLIGVGKERQNFFGKVFNAVFYVRSFQCNATAHIAVFEIICPVNAKVEFPVDSIGNLIEIVKFHRNASCHCLSQ